MVNVMEGFKKKYGCIQYSDADGRKTVNLLPSFFIKYKYKYQQKDNHFNLNNYNPNFEKTNINNYNCTLVHSRM